MKRVSPWIKGLLSMAMVAILSGCGGGSTNNGVAPLTSTTSASTASRVATASFDLTAGTLQAIPHPADALLRGTTGGKTASALAYGHNTLPGTTSAVTAFNTLSGFSTSAPIYIPFSGSLDPSTVTSANVMVVNGANVAQSMTLSVLTGTSGDTIVALPTRPLAASTTFTVIVTDRVLSSQGVPALAAGTTLLLQQTSPLVSPTGQSVTAGVSDAQAQQLEALRQVWQPIWSQAQAVSGLTLSHIPVAFSFTTQSLYTTLQTLNAHVQTTTAATPTVTGINGLPTGTWFGTVMVNNLFTALSVASVPHTHIGGVYVGTFSSPNYISYADPANPAGAPWVMTGGLPTVQSARTQQFITCLPNPTSFPTPGAGYPTVIYVHGITRNMFDMLAVADGLNQAGIAVIAINQPLHGSNDLIPGNAYKNIDQGDGYGFINLSNLLTGRDNLRQSAADLYELTHLITAGNTKFDTTNYPNQALLADNPGVLGQSLGSIVGTLLTATEGANDVSVLNVGGGRIGSLLQNSPTFTPTINAQLAAAGVATGSADYQNFFWIAQTVLDDADSFNYGQFFNTDTIRGTTPGRPHYSLLQEMIDDQTVPNSATTDLARAMNVQQAYAKSVISGLTQVATALGVQGSSIYQFSGGAHGFMINGTSRTAACQTQVVTYFGGYFASLPGGPSITDIQPIGTKLLEQVGLPWLDATVRASGVFFR